MARYNYMANTTNTGYSIFNYRVSKPGKNNKGVFQYCPLDFSLSFFPDSLLRIKCLKFSLCYCSIWDTFLSIENNGKTKESKENILYSLLNYFGKVQSHGYVWNTLHSYYKIHKCFYIPLVSRRLKKQGNGPPSFSPCCMFTTVIVMICRQTPAQVWGVRRK